MSKNKAIFITALTMGMFILIILGLFAMKIAIWMAFIGILALCGLYLVANKFFNWLMDDAPLVGPEFRSEEEDFGDIPLN